ncbi:MAG: CPBP family glutamic-type intramembrane protease, partial [Phycisphaerae bacterium]
ALTEPLAPMQHLNATTTERELGTLESLLITPASRLELLTAKTLLVLISGLLTALLNMFSMSLVLWRAFTIMSESSTAFGISFSDLALSYLAAVPAIIFFACLVLIVGLIARNFREANSFASPVMLLPLAAVFVAMAEPPSTNALMLMPVVNTTLIIRDVLTARAVPLHFFLAFASSCLYAGLMLSAAVRLFSNEQLVNPSWEPLNFGFRRRIKGSSGLRLSPPRGLPSIDAALALYSLTLLISVNVSISMLQHKLDLLTQVLIIQLGIITAPALILAWWARYDWPKTFMLRLPPAPAIRLQTNSTRPISLPPAVRWARPMFSTTGYFAAALVLGAALVPVIQALAQGQNLLWPDNTTSDHLQNEMLFSALIAHPIFAALLMASLAGICEELLYRGLIMTALRRRLPVGLAITITAFMFAFAHFEFHALPLRMLLGIIMGWLAYRTNSLIPAILTHFAYDAATFLYIAYYVHSAGLEKALAGANASTQMSPGWLIATALGTLATAACGWAIYRWTEGQKSEG